MPDRDEIRGEDRRLRAVTQQTRLRVVESKLSVAFTFCTAAETCINIDDAGQARASIEQAERMAASARLSIGTSHDLPIAILQSQLGKLEERVRELKLRLDSNTASRSEGDSTDGMSQ